MRSENEQHVDSRLRHRQRLDVDGAGQKDDYRNRIKLFYGCFKNKT